MYKIIFWISCLLITQKLYAAGEMIGEDQPNFIQKGLGGTCFANAQTDKVNVEALPSSSRGSEGIMVKVKKFPCPRPNNPT